MKDWSGFFKPRSIALVGASRTPGKIGYILWQKLKLSGLKLFLVNPHFGYADLQSIPGKIDLAVIAVPAAAVPAVIADCVTKKVKAVVIISAGFAEIGEAGVRLDPPPIPVLGPNCFGLANPHDRLDTTFAQAAPRPGNIALVSQSGALASYLFNWAAEEKLGFSKFISLGNRLNLDETDCLDYLVNDPDSRLIAVYLESFRDPVQWLKIASRVSRKKPVVVLLGGQTGPGAKASLSHTASLSPQPAAALALLRQSGCLAAKDLADFTNLLEVFSLEPRLKDNDLAIITNAGGPAILAVDTAVSLSLDVGKPIDVLGDALADRFQTAFDQVIGDKRQDAYLVIITPQANTEMVLTCRALAKRFKNVNKPVIVSLLGGRLAEPAREILKQQRIATIDLPQEAVKGLAALLKYHRQQPYPLYPARRTRPVRPKQLAWSGKLEWFQAAALAQAYQIPLVKTVKLEQPVKPADFAWPVVLKADPALAQHRTENKAIYLNLKTASAVRLAFRSLKRRFPAILCQEQLTQGQELFIGIGREANFPPLLTLGLGGIYTELFRDVARMFLPVNAAAVSQLLKQTKIGRIIYGYRSGAKLSPAAVVKLILDISRLVEDYEQIKTVEINPALVKENSLAVVDLKITSSTLPEV